MAKQLPCDSILVSFNLEHACEIHAHLRECIIRTAVISAADISECTREHTHAQNQMAPKYACYSAKNM
jgi:hypothetical protein